MTAAILSSTEVLIAVGGGLASAVAAIGAHRLVRDRRTLTRRRVGTQATAARPPRAPAEHGHGEPERSGPVDAPLPPQALATALSGRDCVLFIGSELGRDLGLTSWPETLARVVDTLAYEYPGGDWETLRARLLAGETELVADVLRSRVSEDYLRDIIVEVSEPHGDEVAPVFHQLAEMPFAGVVTDIWSEAIPTLFRARRPLTVRPGGRQDLTTLLHNERFFVARVHGSPRDESSLILSWEDYRNALVEDVPFGRFVSSLASSRVLLFLGASETDIELFMLGSHIRSGSREHYALVPWHENVELQSERLRSRFGVHLLPYSMSAPEALEEFATTLGRWTRMSKHEASYPAAPALTELFLENIGPFEELELPLDEATNVLLGANASGKSTILRALALGLAGDVAEMRAAAQELLRVGESSGSISIIAGRERFRVVLRRTPNGVHVVAETLSPVAAGAMLALGFPPLRGIAPAPAESPSYEPARGPGAEDLGPLVLNDVDPRLEGVVQWIVNTASRALNGGADARRHHEELLARFFEIVARLTPAIRIEYSGVDHYNKQHVVLISTDDGVIPITRVSRGMIAVLSWVGVLLQRLDEAYPRRPEEARMRPALLLVDEIDLHLHPEWQRQILPLMREHFPNLQIIASTHSPLVVGSLDHGQLVRLQRTRDGITHDVLVPRSFDALRSDQILTSTAFELATTRDVRTEALMDEYERLISSETLDEMERTRATELAQALRLRMPQPQETLLGRRAAALVGDALEQRLRAYPPEERQALAQEAERYLLRLCGGEPT